MRTSSRGRRLLPAVLAGAVALVVGLVCGGLVFGGAPRQPEPPTDATTTAPAAAPSSPPAADPPPSPGPSPGQAGGELLPDDLSFVEVAGVRLPTSDAAGPGETGGGVARGFARDRAGVALAAAHLLLRVHPQVGADVFGPTVAEQVVGEHRDALAANVSAGYEQLLGQWPVPYGQPAGTLHLAMPGYRIDTFTGQAATVVLLLEVPDGDGLVLGATSVQMRWHNGDWALVAPAGGSFADTTSLVEDTGGFTWWEP